MTQRPRVKLFVRPKPNCLVGSGPWWHPLTVVRKPLASDFSKQFKHAEIHYPTPDKEMMAIVESFRHWRHYLDGSRHPIEVWSDHQNLQGFMKQPKINGRQARWLIYLSPYDFTIPSRKVESRADLLRLTIWHSHEQIIGISR